MQRSFVEGIPNRHASSALRSSRLWPILLLLVTMWLVSGCVVTPIGAQGEEGLPGSNATIAVAPVSGEPGDEVFVSGAGWQAGEIVYINLEDTPDTEPIQTTVGIATASDEGRFNVSFTFPIDPIWREPKVIDIVAYSLESGARATAEFEVLETAAPTATATPVATATATAVATGQPTPTRTPVPTATPAQNRAVVVSSALNVRRGPSTAFSVIRSISRGTEFTVIGQNNSGAWLSIRLNDGTEGWVARAYTSFTGMAPVVPSPRPPSPTAAPTATRPPKPPFITGWRGEYFDNPNLNGAPRLVRDDQNIDFDWGYGSPGPGIPADNFSARWVRSFFLPAGNYRFYAQADDGVRVWVDGELIIDEWHASSGVTYTADKQLNSGSHLLRIEYFEARELAKIRVWWSTAGDYPAWRGEYYPNKDLRGPASFVRNDNAIDFDWGRGGPASNFPSDNFSVRWTRDMHFDSGTYRFHARMDDGMRVYLDDTLIIDQWYNSSVREATADVYVGYGTHRLRVEYYEDALYAVAQFWFERISDPQPPDDFDDWKGEYWTNRHLDGSPRVVRNDEKIDFNWGTGSPDSRIPDDNFSARWTRRIDFDDGWYRFYARADDGVRVWVGDDRIINEWHDGDYGETYTADIYIDDDERVKVEYYERTGGARIRVWWERIGDKPTATPTPGPTNPYLDVVPDTGGAGTEVTATGGGFPANTRVNLYLGGIAQASALSAGDAQVRASTTTDRNGLFSMTFDMPATWPDGTPLEAGRLVVLVATEDFETEASAVFEYVPGPTTPTATPAPTAPDPYASVSPGSGGAGTRVTVSGGGFPRNTDIDVYLAGLASVAAASPSSYASGRTDDSGNFSLSFNMPDEWPDDDDVETGKIVILVATRDFEVQASTDFDFFVDAPNPSIDISPSSGTAGTQVNVSGGGFPANSRVMVNLGTLDEQIGQGAEEVYASTTTDRFGNYSMSFRMPTMWPDGSTVESGRIVVLVANSDYSVVASGTFDYSAPAGTPTTTPTATATPGPTATPTRAPHGSVSPTSGGAGTRVTVTGGGFPANRSIGAYLGEFDGGGGFADDAERYASATTDENGNFSISFRLPEEWPDGDDIESGRILIIVATDDFGTMVSAVFNYNRAAAAGGVDADAVTPTLAPTATATVQATDTPSPAPTGTPTRPPRQRATATPTDEAVEEPTDEPTDEATEEPTEEPTDEPTAEATEEPTAEPTEAATEEVTEEPEEEPADEATEEATAEPSPEPSVEPTATQDEAVETPVDEDASDEDTSAGQGEVDEPTATPEPPTNTPEPTATQEPTATPEPPTNTPEPTATPVPPTNTPEPTATPLPPTNTPEPPTATPVPPTATPVPPTATSALPTNTPAPPTNTPVPPTSVPELPPPSQPVTQTLPPGQGQGQEQPGD